MSHMLIVTDVGGGNPVRLQTNGVSAGWSVGSSSTLSAEVMAADLVAAGLVRPKGKWCFWTDEDAGPLNGVITDSQANADATVEIAVEDWRRLFNKRRIPTLDEASFGPAGALALIAISNAQTDDFLWINEQEADEVGEPVDLAWDGGDLRAALDNLTMSSGQEYAVDPDTRDFEWRERIGTDLSNSVGLTLGRHITAYTLPDSIDPVINDLLAVPSNEQYAVSQALAVFDDTSIEAIGRQQGTQIFTEGVTESVLRPVANAALARLTKLGASIEMSIVNEDYCWAWFREGDSISILLPNIGSRLTVRVMARALDTGSQEMRVSAVVEEWTVF